MDKKVIKSCCGYSVFLGNHSGISQYNIPALFDSLKERISTSEVTLHV